VYFGGGHAASFYCTLEDCWKNLRVRNSLSKHLKEALRICKIAKDQVAVGLSVQLCFAVVILSRQLILRDTQIIS